MTKSTITREQLEEWVAQFDEDGGCDATDRQLEALIRQSLAAMDSSESVELPLDYLQGYKDGLDWTAQLAEANHPETGDWLYDDPIELAKAIRKGPDMPPVQPVADSEPVAWTWQHLKQWHVTNDEERARDLAWDGVKVEPLYRRAAMLQAGTLTNEGTKQAWTGIPDIDNAINMLDRIDTLDSCDDDRIEAVKTVLRRLAGNSPVIPDGYVMVPKEMTDEIGEAIAMQANCCGGIALDIYDAMIAAAPHDTPALNSVQSVVHVSDGWIPVSERMPESNGVYFGWDGKRVLEVYCFFGGFSANQFIHGEITHWMPLPAGPKEVKSE